MLHLRGVDFMDGTPVLDVKPYLPYADCMPQAEPGYTAEGPPPPLPVELSRRARTAIYSQTRMDPQKLERLIEQILAQDPRPAYRRKKDEPRTFGTALADFNVRWQVVAGRVQVLTVGLRESS